MQAKPTDTAFFNIFAIVNLLWEIVSRCREWYECQKNCHNITS